MLKYLETYFEFAHLGTNWRTEILAGVTTFLTMRISCWSIRPSFRLPEFLWPLRLWPPACLLPSAPF